MSELGNVLRSARQEKNLTIADVARATRIKPSYLEALEHGDYGLLPGPAYITGFLRNYASYLGLHPDDVVQQYYAVRPTPTPTVQPVSKVLASGQSRQHRTRLVWSLATVFLLLGGGFAIKQYNDTYAHPYSPPNITPPNLGNPEPAPAAAPRHVARPVTVALQSSRPVWVRVVVDGHAAFGGVLRPGARPRQWTGHGSIYVATFHGARLQANVDGHPMGPMSHQPGLVVDEATPSGWRRVA